MLKRTLTIYFVLLPAFVAGSRGTQPALYGQSVSGPPSVRLPVLGFVVDDAHHLRPLIGIPGSASVGAPLDMGIEIRRAAIPSSLDYIVAMTSDGKGDRARLIQVRRGALSLYPAGVDDRATIDRVALSPSGSAAAFFSESQRRIYVLMNLAQSPALVADLEIREARPLTALAVSDDGKAVAVGVSDGNAGALFFLSSGRRPRLVRTMRRPSAISFLHQSGDAIVADDIDNAIYAVTGGQPYVVASTDSGIPGPTGIAVSKDNQKIFAANAAAGSVTVISHGTAAEPQYCNCTLTGLYPTGVDSVFRLTDFSGGPIVLFDGRGMEPRLTFVRVQNGG